MDDTINNIKNEESRCSAFPCSWQLVLQGSQFRFSFFSWGLPLPARVSLPLQSDFLSRRRWVFARARAFVSLHLTENLKSPMALPPLHTPSGYRPRPDQGLRSVELCFSLFGLPGVHSYVANYNYGRAGISVR
ncbi:hypothetical protein E2C01_055853 [Portunus trituberculatus]|uniref:Uncharacterized protein n=1 Tax=Portunus trituberculatus TaxID=210409 RepID=A0A5B7GX84_PORTR|nr:hypothetical protein [Portunus trituberculatus]